MVSSFRLSIFLTLVLFIYSTTLFSKIDLSQLENEIGSRLDRVEQFKAIKELAREYGIKHIYLFGGTASAWAHYVYQDLEREAGDQRYPKSRFNYDYTEIFRANQDMDILIDGTVEQAEKLEKALADRFDFFQGTKSVFEVRLKSVARGDKDALTDPNFYSQNTDSHSTGLVKLVGNGEKIVQDTREPNTSHPQFLKDVYEKKLHFYYDHSKHITTKRYKEGKNPEIFAVIRHLIKMFQFELSTDDESWKNMQKIIAEFDPETAKVANSYIGYWLEKNGPKLFQNAVNMEFAWNTLEKLGLRQKLIKASNPEKVESLGFWMNKIPLPSFEVGRGDGRTARELGITTVAHETRSFSAFESITKAKDGSPNVFSSRKNTFGETAAHGDGFYTKRGRTGAIGTGITIRFEALPEAREGTDFFLADNGNYVVWINKAAFKYTFEEINFSPLEYFEKLARGEFVFDNTDKGILHNVHRRIRVNMSGLSIRDKAKIRSLLKTTTNKNFFSEAMALIPEIIKYSPDALLQYMKNSLLSEEQLLSEDLLTKAMQYLSQYPYSQLQWRELFKKSESTLEDIRYKDFLTLLFVKQPNSVMNHDLLKSSTNNLGLRTLLFLLTDKEWRENGPYKAEDLWAKLKDIQSYNTIRASSYKDFFINIDSLNKLDQALFFEVKTGDLFTSTLEEIIKIPHWKKRPDLIQIIAEARHHKRSSYFFADDHLPTSVLNYFAQDPKNYGEQYFKEIMRMGKQATLSAEEIKPFGTKEWRPYLKRLLQDPHFQENPYNYLPLFLLDEAKESLPLLSKIPTDIKTQERVFKLLFNRHNEVSRLLESYFYKYPEVFNSLISSTKTQDLYYIVFKELVLNKNKMVEVLGEKNYFKQLILIHENFRPKYPFPDTGVNTALMIFNIQSESASYKMSFEERYRTLGFFLYKKNFEILSLETNDNEAKKVFYSIYKLLNGELPQEAISFDNLNFSKLSKDEIHNLLNFVMFHTSGATKERVIPVAIKQRVPEFIKWAREWERQFGSDGGHYESFRAGEAIRASLSGCNEWIREFMK